MLAGAKSFVAIPGAGLTQFQEALAGLLDEFGSGGGVASGQGTPPPTEPLPGSREVRAGTKKFFFDVARNERGTFLRLSEVGLPTSSSAWGYTNWFTMCFLYDSFRCCEVGVALTSTSLIHAGLRSERCSHPMHVTSQPVLTMSPLGV